MVPTIRFHISSVCSSKPTRTLAPALLHRIETGPNAASVAATAAAHSVEDCTSSASRSPAARGADLVGNLLGLVQKQVGHAHRRALAGEQPRLRPAHRATAARDQRHLALKFHRCLAIGLRDGTAMRTAKDLASGSAKRTRRSTFFSIRWRTGRVSVSKGLDDDRGCLFGALRRPRGCHDPIYEYGCGHAQPGEIHAGAERFGHHPRAVLVREDVSNAAIAGTDGTLTGVAAVDRDFLHALFGSFPYVLALVLILTLILLTRAFRSIVLAVKAVRAQPPLARRGLRDRRLRLPAGPRLSLWGIEATQSITA